MSSWAQLQSASVAQTLAWAEGQPWAGQMASCSQDSIWHAEGDVWTHTRMVCTELEKLAEWPALGRERQRKLLFAALFHDVGKPATTMRDPATGRTHSPKHSLASASIARKILRDLECELQTREEIATLARFHGRPAHFLQKENPEREVISLSWLLNNRLLYLLALADTRGRRTADMARPEENLHLWKMLAEEKGCFEKPYSFPNNHARFLFFREELISLHYTPHENFRSRVALLSGLPGVGKDSWLARNRPSVPVVSLDAIREDFDASATGGQGRVIQAAREQCREHLRAGRDFAFNATNITRLTRRRWIDLFASYNARVEIVYLEPPVPAILAQNKSRENPVPETVILRMLEKLEPPSLAECHELLFV